MKIIVPSMIVPDFEKSTPAEPRIDLEATGKLFHFILGGLNDALGDYKYAVEKGFLLLSATTQGHEYGPEVIPALVERARKADKDVYIAVGAWETERYDVRDYIKEAADSGVDVFLPGSLKKETPLEEYVRFATQGFLEDVNFILYENPGLTGLSFDIDLIKRLTEKRIVIGIKDSNSSPQHFEGVLRIPNLKKILGAEELYHIFLQPLYKGDLHGIVPSTANVCPEFIGEMVRHYLDNNYGTLAINIADLKGEIHPDLYGKNYERKYSSLLYCAALNGCGPKPEVIQKKYALNGQALEKLTAVNGL